MRSFSEIEKDYLKKIITAYNSNNWNELILKNLIYSTFKRTIIFKDFPGFEIHEGESDDKDEKIGYNNAIKNGYIPIAIFFNLLKGLEQNSFISIIPYFETVDFDLDIVGEEKENQPIDEEFKHYFSIIDQEYLGFLRNNYSRLIYPTQELIDLVNSNFKPKEERRYKYQMIATWSSIFIAILIGIAGYFKPNDPVKIDNGQANQILRAINQHDNQIEDIEFSLDSFRVEVNSSLQKIMKIKKKKKHDN